MLYAMVLQAMGLEKAFGMFGGCVHSGGPIVMTCSRFMSVFST